MMEHALLWLKFLLAAGAIVFAGLALTREAERLAAALGWGHAFAGFVILGWATSLPELTISVSAVTVVGSAPLSTGNIAGSIVFNLGILAALDLWVGRRRVRDAAHVGGLRALGLFNVALLGGLMAVVWVPGGFGAGTGTGWLPPAWMIGLYLGATVHSWWSERHAGDRAAVTPHPEDIAAALHGAAPGSTPVLAARCLLLAAVILVTGLWLTRLGDAIARTYDLQQGFVGSLFLAVTSSLPELVTGLAAVRVGLHVMAAGSILGSNIFNMAILGACDLLYQARDGAGGTLVGDAVTAEPGRMQRMFLFALLMTVVALCSKERQRADPSRPPSRALAVCGLTLYAIVMAWA